MEARIIHMSDTHIVQGCQDGDRNSQRQLYEKYFESMTWVCYRYLRERSLVEDIVHEGFIKIFQKIGTYSGKGSLEGWMKRIMVNTCLDYLRKHKRLVSEVDLEEAKECSMPEQAVADMQANQILELVQELSDMQRTVFNLYVMEGFPHKEIAQMLNIGPSTSRAYLTEAKRNLRQKIQYLEAGMNYRLENG
ncbi:sigma-70 family RNA polymerase sigma factor [Pontibacter sp. G13]|uniref:RNA polymerase sigma factor n=1 Tax=Pontibacter sp. G13 TaxID=3074898 RepID=UPI00288B3CC8|nr:sigma-70 family RNA polymerase sigma factor [Pontibacter sp. G13]WNJ16886.1 sigma-70 family RNA polymerase sigma factor [Pontibacter sp. G13]